MLPNENQCSNLDWLKTKKKWRNYGRAVIRGILKQSYINLQAAQPKFIESSLAVAGAIGLCGLIVFGALVCRGCARQTAQAGEIGLDTPSKINRMAIVALQKQTNSSFNKGKDVKPYSDQEIVAAIWQVEGGSNTKFPYGIRSLHCEKKEECREICLRTVRNNRIRYKNYGYKKYPLYLSFLASRYCPINSRNGTQTENKLNKYWLSNIKYFLKKGRS